MNDKVRSVLIELLWIAVIFCVIASLLFSKMQWNSKDSTFDIHFHDTYFVISFWQLILPLFLFAAFLVLYIKEIAHRFTRIIPNWFLLITGIANIAFVGFMHYQLVDGLREISSFSNSEFVETSIQLRIAPEMFFFITAQSVWQFIVIVALLPMCYLWGRRSIQSF